MAKTDAEKAQKKRWKKTAAGRDSRRRYRQSKRRRNRLESTVMIGGRPYRLCPDCGGRIKAQGKHDLQDRWTDLFQFWRLFCTRCGRRFSLMHDSITACRKYSDRGRVSLPNIRRRWYGYG